MDRLTVVALSLGLGFSLGRLLRRLGFGFGRSEDEDPVSASGKLIAAWRALESLEPPGARLFLDPFASALAGAAAVQQALALAKPWPHTGSSGGSDGSRSFCYSNVSTRVWWFDRQLLSALQPASPAGTREAPAPRQVVVLGAGFDTRPWRLSLPSGVHWFEVDMPHVVEAKRKLLRQLGAGLDEAQALPPTHPLRAARWAALPADLARPGWTDKLVAAGLDPRQPTVWVLEGLLMYLTAEEAAALLQEMAGACAQGSVLIAHNTGQELYALIASGAGAAAYHPFPAELVSTWRSGFPAASEAAELAVLLAQAGGWRVQEATGRAQIVADICSGPAAAAASAGQAPAAAGSAGDSSGEDAAQHVRNLSMEAVAERCDFEARPNEGRDRWAVFFTAAL